MTLDEFFAGFQEARPIFDEVLVAAAELGDPEMRVMRSQIVLRHARDFAWVWVPDRYLGGGHAPLVLSLAFRHKDSSARWKQVVEPRPGRFMHHLELRSAAEVDEQVRAWMRRAWDEASEPGRAPRP